MKYVFYWVSIILILTLFACSTDKNSATQASSNMGSTRVEVEGLIVESKVFDQNLTLTGSLMANEFVDIVSEVNGRVTSINFKEGQTVEKGRVLIRVNDLELVAQINRVKANMELAQTDLQRKTELLQARAIPQEELERASHALKITVAEMELLNAQLEKHTIRAPFSGIIGLREISLGSYVSPGMLITKLFQINPIKIEFNVPEKYSNQLGANSQFTFRLDGMQDTFTGRIYAIDPAVEANTRTFKIRGQAPNPKSIFKGGGFVSVELPLKTTQNAILIPASSVSADLRGQKILVIEEGKVKSRIIQTGVRTQDRVLVESGLEVGDTLITSGLLQLREGTEVQLKEIHSESQKVEEDGAKEILD